MDEKYDLRPMDNARNFLDFIRRSHPEWLKEGQRKSDMIFRGHPNADYSLKPSAWRENENLERIFKNVKKEIESAFKLEAPHASSLDEQIHSQARKIEPDHAERISSYVWKITCELYLANDFIHRANNIGLKVSKVNPFKFITSATHFPFLCDRILLGDKYFFGKENKDVTPTIKAIINGNLKINELPSENFFDSNFTTFALAQHHDIPTRFLDWTKDPLKAAYFALNKIDPSAKEIAVFALDSTSLTSYGIHVVDAFPHSDFHFLHMQEGVFTYMTNANGWFLRYGSWPSTEDMLSEKGHAGIGLLSSLLGPPLSHPKPIKITLNVEHTDELRRLLEAEGITQESLMPTYNHVADAIRKRFTGD